MPKGDSIIAAYSVESANRDGRSVALNLKRPSGPTQRAAGIFHPIANITLQ